MTGPRREAAPRGISPRFEVLPRSSSSFLLRSSKLLGLGGKGRSFDVAESPLEMVEEGQQPRCSWLGARGPLGSLVVAFGWVSFASQKTGSSSILLGS